MSSTCTDCGTTHLGVPCPRSGSGDLSGTAATRSFTAPAPAAYRGAGSARPTHSGARFVGDAQPFGGIPLSRLLNAACYVLAGIAALVLSAQPGAPDSWLIVLFGLGSMAYGAKIVLTRSSYWVNSFVYLLAVGAVAAMFGSLGR